MNQKVCTIPTALTMFRLGFALTVSPFLLMHYLPQNDYYSSKLLALMMFVLVLTDFLDGYLARACNTVTSFGKFLDPLADKCLVGGTLLVLIYLKRIVLIGAIVIIAREIIISVIRYSAAQLHGELPVNKWGKWKTTLQYSYLMYVIGTPWIPAYDFFIETTLLIVTIIITVLSAFFYIKKFLKLRNKG